MARWDLQGRTILVTGAARGIGAESARKLAARGAQVALAGLEPEQLERVAAECGPGAAWFECDVTDDAALEAAVDGTLSRFGAIDGVIANAGVAPAGMVRSMDPAPFERTIDINLLGVWRTVRLAVPHVVERRGYILIVASLAAFAHTAGMAAYTASKAGAEAFGDALRSELRHLGVDVGVGYFSWIATDLVAGADDHPVFGRARAELPGPLGKTYPVSAVGDAVVDGFERRRRYVVVPRWVRPALPLRGFIGPLLDIGQRRRVPELDAGFLADVEARGREQASALAGAGGAAAQQESSATPG
jgi:NAD(P)-dependent dehydrogenase (short-subunit alcohol dehydrogenase family)